MAEWESWVTEAEDQLATVRVVSPAPAALVAPRLRSPVLLRRLLLKALLHLDVGDVVRVEEERRAVRVPGEPSGAAGVGQLPRSRESGSLLLSRG